MWGTAPTNIDFYAHHTSRWTTLIYIAPFISLLHLHPLSPSSEAIGMHCTFSYLGLSKVRPAHLVVRGYSAVPFFLLIVNQEMEDYTVV